MTDPTESSCSEASARAGEPLAGSASEAPLFAAVSWPKARWHPDKIGRSEGLPASLAELEKVTRAAGHRLQLRLMQRDGAAATDRVEVVCADFARGRSAHLRDVPAGGAAAAIEAFLAGEVPGEPLRAPLVLICTDGRHDRCCGKLGRSLLAALRGSVDVAESSHLGGHRLAPNCLALPSGRLYGRVGEADVPGLLAALRQDRVYLPCYRGRTGLSELAQVAEAAALAKGPLGDPEPAGEATQISVALGSSRFEVTCARRTFTGIGSCGDAEPEQRERWVAISVRADSALP
jgi:hypothetical protein